jgi:hypothetical protein
MIEEREICSLIKQNVYILEKIQEYIEEGNFEAIKVMMDLMSNILVHVSLTKAILVITGSFEHHPVLKEPRAKLKEVHQERMSRVDDDKKLKGFLETTDAVPFHKIPKRYKASLEKYMFGKTAAVDVKGRMMVYHNNFSDWLKKEKVLEKYKVLRLGTSD